MIALDAVLRLDGIPALTFWEQVLEMHHPNPPKRKIQVERLTEIDRFLHELDYVRSTMPEPVGLAKLTILEDNEPVIKLTI